MQQLEAWNGRRKKMALHGVEHHGTCMPRGIALNYHLFDSVQINKLIKILFRPLTRLGVFRFVSIQCIFTPYHIIFNSIECICIRAPNGAMAKYACKRSRCNQYAINQAKKFALANHLLTDKPFATNSAAEIKTQVISLRRSLGHFKLQFFNCAPHKFPMNCYFSWCN